MREVCWKSWACFEEKLTFDLKCLGLKKTMDFVFDKKDVHQGSRGCASRSRLRPQSEKPPTTASDNCEWLNSQSFEVDEGWSKSIKRRARINHEDHQRVRSLKWDWAESWKTKNMRPLSRAETENPQRKQYSLKKSEDPVIGWIR